LAVLAVIADTDNPSIPQTNPPGALDLQKEGIDRIIDPEELKAPPGQRAILDLRARLVKA
jgi:hypothetical protein